MRAMYTYESYMRLLPWLQMPGSGDPEFQGFKQEPLGPSWSPDDFSRLGLVRIGSMRDSQGLSSIPFVLTLEAPALKSTLVLVPFWTAALIEGHPHLARLKPGDNWAITPRERFYAALTVHLRAPHYIPLAAQGCLSKYRSYA